MEFLSLLEIIGSVFGIIAVYLYICGKYTSFIVGLGNTILSIFICLYKGIYGVALINVYYSIMNFTGWITWKRSERKRTEKGDTSYIPFSYSNGKDIFFFGLLLVIFFPALFFGIRFVNSEVFVLDSLTTAIGFTAIVMSVRKKVDAWLLWIIYDILCVFLFAWKEAYFFSAQYVIYIGMGIYGWYYQHTTFYKTEKMKKI